MAGKAHSARGAAASRRWVPRGGAATGMGVTSTLFIFPKSPHLPARLAALLQGRDAAMLPAERPVAEEELRAGLLALPRAGGGGPWPGTALGCAAGCGRCCAPVVGALGSLWVAPAEGGVEPGCQLLPAIGRSAHSASRGHKGIQLAGIFHVVVLQATENIYVQTFRICVQTFRWIRQRCLCPRQAASGRGAGTGHGTPPLLAVRASKLLHATYQLDNMDSAPCSMRHCGLSKILAAPTCPLAVCSVPGSGVMGTCYTCRPWRLVKDVTGG